MTSSAARLNSPPFNLSERWSGSDRFDAPTFLACLLLGIVGLLLRRIVEFNFDLRLVCFVGIIRLVRVFYCLFLRFVRRAQP